MKPAVSPNCLVYGLTVHLLIDITSLRDLYNLHNTSLIVRLKYHVVTSAFSPAFPLFILSGKDLILLSTDHNLLTFVCLVVSSHNTPFGSMFLVIQFFSFCMS